MYNCNCIVFILAYATGSGPSVSKFHSIVSVKFCGRRWRAGGLQSEAIEFL